MRDHQRTCSAWLTHSHVQARSVPPTGGGRDSPKMAVFSSLYLSNQAENPISCPEDNLFSPQIIRKPIRTPPKNQHTRNWRGALGGPVIGKPLPTNHLVSQIPQIPNGHVRYLHHLIALVGVHLKLFCYQPLAHVRSSQHMSALFPGRDTRLPSSSLVCHKLGMWMGFSAAYMATWPPPASMHWTYPRLRPKSRIRFKCLAFHRAQGCHFRHLIRSTQL